MPSLVSHPVQLVLALLQRLERAVLIQRDDDRLHLACPEDHLMVGDLGIEREGPSFIQSSLLLASVGVARREQAALRCGTARNYRLILTNPQENTQSCPSKQAAIPTARDVELPSRPSTLTIPFVHEPGTYSYRRRSLRTGPVGINQAGTSNLPGG